MVACHESEPRRRQPALAQAMRDLAEADGTVTEIEQRLMRNTNAYWIETLNAAVQRDIPYNPTVKDGRTTKGLAIDKTNWAMPLEKPPYEAYCTTCGVTFTFGGLKIDNDGRVLDTAQKVIPGLYAAGELVGGLFYFNYPGGSGLTSGAVFGRIAGTSAARADKN